MAYMNQIPDAKNWQNLNHDQKAQVVKQMYKQEGGTALNGPQQYDPKNPVDSLARTWLQTGQSNRSRQDAPEGTIEARGRELAQQFGLPSDFNPATASASVKADIGSLVDLQGRLDNSNASLKIVNDNSDLLLKGMQTAGINPNAPFVNELQNAADQKLIGSGDFAAFELADDRQRRIRKPAQGHPPIC